MQPEWPKKRRRAPALLARPLHRKRPFPVSALVSQTNAFDRNYAVLGLGGYLRDPVGFAPRIAFSPASVLRT